MTAGQRLFVGLLIAVLLGGSILYSSKATGEAEVIGVGTLEFHVELKQGWNLVVWGSDTQPPDSAFASIASYHLVMAYGWQNDTQSFNRYVPGRPEISTLSEVEKDNAYWLLMKGEFLLSMPPSASECPAPTPSVSDLWGDACAHAKVGIEMFEVLLDIADAGELVGATESEVRAQLAQLQQYLDQDCQGVTLAEPSSLTSACALAGMWVGITQREMLYDPDPQTQIWINQFDDIIDHYCEPSY